MCLLADGTRAFGGGSLGGVTGRVRHGNDQPSPPALAMADELCFHLQWQELKAKVATVKLKDRFRGLRVVRQCITGAELVEMVHRYLGDRAEPR